MPVFPRKKQGRQNRLVAKRQDSIQLEYETCEPRHLLAAVTGSGFGTEVFAPLNHEAIVLGQLAADASTLHLQHAESALEMVDLKTVDGDTTTLFQQTWAGLPIHGAFITTIQDAQYEMSTYDRGLKNLSGFNSSTQASISSNDAIQIANSVVQDAQQLASESELTWYRSGDSMRLTWQVQTFINPDSQTPDYLTFVDAHSSVVLEQQESPRDEASYVLDNPDTIAGVYPRIVINDAIGASGSRAYAAPFDSVVSISVGCTGTLIAPNVVLSARHCGIGPGAEIVFGDQDSFGGDYSVTVASSSNPDGNGTLLDGGDVSILTLSENVPASVATPMRLTDSTSSLVGQVAVTLGYGYNGLGSQGHGFTADGFRWGGENIIDVYGSPASNNGSNIFSTDFDNGSSNANTIGSSSATPLTNEATTAPGDSGGPLLVQVGSEWVIAGVLSGGTTNTSVYGDISWWTGIADFQSEIESAGGEFVGATNGLGSVAFDADSYVVGDTVNITVTDSNGSGPVNVTLVSDSGDSETLTLANAGGSTYTGSLTVSGATVSNNDGVLQASVTDQITVTYVDPDDGTGNSATVNDVATILIGDIATSESNSSGSVTSGSFVDTHTSNDVHEVITEEGYGGRRSRLEHRWAFDVTSGASVTFNLEAYHNSSVEDFVFEYSTNGGSTWTSMLTVTQSSDTGQSANVGSLSGDVLVRVIDTDRSRKENSLDSIFIDEMYFSAEAPTPGVVLTESSGSTNAAEGGVGDSYTFALETVPSDTVSVAITPDSQIDLGNGAGVAISLTFTPQNALVPQTVNVTAVDDSVDEGNHTGQISHSVTSNDQDYNGLGIPNVTVAIVDNDSTGGGTDVANSESSIDGIVTSGSFADTHSSDNTREVIIEESYAGNKRTRMQHQWSFNVSGGSSVSFNLEAFHNSSVEDFIFAYSTNGGSSWTNMLTVTQATETTQSVDLGNISGDVLVRVLDTDRSRNENVRDSIFIDHMYFESDRGRSAALSGPATGALAMSRSAESVNQPVEKSKAVQSLPLIEAIENRSEPWNTQPASFTKTDPIVNLIDFDRVFEDANEEFFNDAYLNDVASVFSDNLN